MEVGGEETSILPLSLHRDSNLLLGRKCPRNQLRVAAAVGRSSPAAARPPPPLRSVCSRRANTERRPRDRVRSVGGKPGNTSRAVPLQVRGELDRDTVSVRTTGGGFCAISPG